MGVEVSPINVTDLAEVERAIGDFAREVNGGLIVAASARALTHREPIVTLAARYQLPAVYSTRDFVANGGLISYGADFLDQYHRAATYVDRILGRSRHLPVQAPTKYDLAITKTAKALGLTVPQSLLARADEVIQRTDAPSSRRSARGGVATRGARAEAGDAGDRVRPALAVERGTGGGGLSSGSTRCGLRGRAQRRCRVSLGRGSIRSSPLSRRILPRAVSR